MFETTNLTRNGDETRVMLAKSNNPKKLNVSFIACPKVESNSQRKLDIPFKR